MESMLMEVICGTICGMLDIQHIIYIKKKLMDQTKRYILDYCNFVQTLSRGTFTSKKVIPEK